MAPPTNARIVLFGRVVVLACAAVLSFSALRDLAVACGFRPWQASLFPIMVDAGVAVALASWRSNVFARQMTIALLATTVIGNAVAHILAAYRLEPHWSIVVLVGALAPAVLAAVWWLDLEPVQEPVQLDDQDQDQDQDDELDQDDDQDQELDVQARARQLALAGTGRTLLLRELGPLGLTEGQAKKILRDIKIKAVA